MKRDIDRFSIHENFLDVLRRGNVFHHSAFSSPALAVKSA